MPTNDPSNATDVPQDAREEATPGAVLNDADVDDSPGGGGLGGAAAANALGSGRTPGGASPNAPIDTGVDAGDAGATAEAKVLATQTGVSEVQSQER
ncbi:hypothetical protein [Sphingomonas sp.]|uniref:hypothetical protein n=1 Tax=Sphingomonas sp. TaxID=28214 RepID=UPI0035BBB37B